MLQIAAGFDVEALDELVTMEIVDTAVLDAKDEHEARWVVVGREDPTS